MSKKKKYTIGVSLSILILLVLVNFFAALQAYSITHFVRDAEPIQQTLPVKIKSAFFGLSVPRPQTTLTPVIPFETVQIPWGNNFLDGWVIPSEEEKGIFILFHGYIQEKSSMLDRAYALHDMGYTCILVSFMGCGDSYGDQTTIGALESENVKAVFDYIIRHYGTDNIYLLGFSMGAVAITKAMNDYNMPVSGIVLEAAYANMFEAVEVRIRRIGLPLFPLNYIVSFWMSKVNGFDVFDCNPEEYAKSISIPTMVLCGGRDINVTEEETKKIFNNINTEHKILKIFPLAGHESYLLNYKEGLSVTLCKS